MLNFRLAHGAWIFLRGMESKTEVAAATFIVTEAHASCGNQVLLQ